MDAAAITDTRAVAHDMQANARRGLRWAIFFSLGLHLAALTVQVGGDSFGWRAPTTDLARDTPTRMTARLVQRETPRATATTSNADTPRLTEQRPSDAARTASVTVNAAAPFPRAEELDPPIPQVTKPASLLPTPQTPPAPTVAVRPEPLKPDAQTPELVSPVKSEPKAPAPVAATPPPVPAPLPVTEPTPPKPDLKEVVEAPTAPPQPAAPTPPPVATESAKAAPAAAAAPVSPSPPTAAPQAAAAPLAAPSSPAASPAPATAAAQASPAVLAQPSPAATAASSAPAAPSAAPAATSSGAAGATSSAAAPASGGASGTSGRASAVVTLPSPRASEGAAGSATGSTGGTPGTRSNLPPGNIDGFDPYKSRSAAARDAARELNSRRSMVPPSVAPSLSERERLAKNVEDAIRPDCADAAKGPGLLNIPSVIGGVLFDKGCKIR